jgi:hypothetical protein
MSMKRILQEQAQRDEAIVLGWFYTHKVALIINGVVLVAGFILGHLIW